MVVVDAVVVVVVGGDVVVVVVAVVVVLVVVVNADKSGLYGLGCGCLGAFRMKVGLVVLAKVGLIL